MGGEVRGIDPCAVKHTHITFDASKTTNCLLLAGSLADNINSQLTHIMYVICIIYCVLPIKYTREKKDLRKSVV